MISVDRVIQVLVQNFIRFTDERLGQLEAEDRGIKPVKIRLRITRRRHKGIDGAATGDTARTVRVPFVVMRADFAEGRPYTATATGTGIVNKPELI